MSQPVAKRDKPAGSTSNDDDLKQDFAFIGLGFVLIMLILVMYAWIMRQWISNPDMPNEQIIGYLAGLLVVSTILAYGLIKAFQFYFPKHVAKEKKE